MLTQTMLVFGVGLMLGVHAEGTPVWLVVLAGVLIAAGFAGHAVILTRRQPPQKPQPK